MKKHIAQPGTVEYAMQSSNEHKPRLLLHACCGPCATSVLEYLTPYFDITVFFYNPNIMPNEEFNKRLCALKDVIAHFDSVKLVVPAQCQEQYTTAIKGLEMLKEGGARCGVCFALRLEETAKYLASHKDDFDFFATTLTVSPHKNAPLINEIGNNIAQKYDVQYLASDFKKRDGYLRSTQLCKEWDIYRQMYCGCKFD